MVIITGMDNSGKTTLCNQLSERMGLAVIHSAGPELTPDEKRVWTLDQLAREKVTPNRVIYDRFMPLEEMVYGEVLRDHSDFHFGDIYLEMLAEINPTIIYTRPPRRIILEDNGREQMIGVREKGKKLLNAWDDLFFRMAATGWRMWSHDWTAESLTDEDLEDIFRLEE